MNAHFRLIPEAIALSDAGCKAAVLEELAQRFERAYGFPAADVLEALDEREKLGSTGFGRVEFDAADGMPVELVFGLISPESAGAAHLHALAAISRLVRDEATHRLLVEASGVEALIASLTNAGDRDVA